MKETLKKNHDELPPRAQERINALMATNTKLRQQIAGMKKTERELVESRERLRDLSTHLESAREEERKIIAREIHDVLGQTLTGLKLDLSSLYTHPPKEQEQLHKRIEVILHIIDVIIKKVKGLSGKLRPGLLDDFGITAAIEWHCQSIQNMTGIRCDIHSDPEDIDLNKELSIAIFRIFQQAITNVLDHADATMVKVTLRRQNGKFTLILKDNGKGITGEQISAPRSIGILGMSERARALNGELTIKGVKGHGTTVKVSIPTDTGSTGK